MPTSIFDLAGKVAVVAGGGGVLGSAICRGIADAGAAVAVADRRVHRAEDLVATLTRSGARAAAYHLDAYEKPSIEACSEAVLTNFGKVDILINCIGGNKKEATTTAEHSFFDIPPESLQKVVDLNLIGGTILPCQVFGKHMVNNPNGGSIINISSMNAFRPLTRIPGYSAAKAAVSNFTQWLAVHFAQEYNPSVRVNALAPGFFLTDQNRFLLTDEHTGEPTARGESIIGHTPMGKYGEPDDLIGATIWLASDASRFVTGIVVPIDGGFSAFSGV